MTEQEIIEKVRAEVERLKQEIYPVKVGEQRVNRGPTSMESAALGALNTLMSRISDLEKECEEKPNDQWSEEDEEMLNSAIGFVEHSAFTTIGKGKKNVLAWLKTFPKSTSEKPTTAEGLEEEMIAWHKKHFKGKRKWEETSGEYLEHSSQLDLARHFAQWQKDKMMKEAVDAEVKGYVGGDGLYVEVDLTGTAKFKTGQKVKLVIVKED